MPQTRTGVPQKRAKNTEPHAVKARLEKEKKLGGIKNCIFCGTPVKATFNRLGNVTWFHMFVESAAKFKPHYPEPVLELGKENAD